MEFWQRKGRQRTRKEIMELKNIEKKRVDESSEVCNSLAEERKREKRKKGTWMKLFARRIGKGGKKRKKMSIMMDWEILHKDNHTKLIPSIMG